MSAPIHMLASAMAVTALLALPAAGARGQEPSPGRLDLGTLHAEAVRRDPRARQIDLLAAQSALRLRNLDVERRPSLSIAGRAQYQSDVARIASAAPGTGMPMPPNDTYDAYLSAQQRLYDPSIDARREVERAQLAASQASVRASLFHLRQSVSDAFFSSLLLQASAAELSAAIGSLEAQRHVAEERVRGGTALPSDAAELEAEVLRRRQELDALEAERGAALEVLGELTGRRIAPGQELVLPELASDVSAARAALDELRARPEYQQFARARALLDAQKESIEARERPRVSAFGRAGYGRPGLNPLGTEFDAWWLGGVQLDWTPWTWGATRREQDALALQREIVATEEAAFTESLRRGVARDLAAIDRLERTLASDDTIVSLRERIVREARLRYQEGVITSAELVDRESDLLAARLQRATHRIQLAQTRARFLTLVGIEVR